MPEWIVIYKAIADFSDVTREAAKTLAELEAIKKAAESLSSAEVSGANSAAAATAKETEAIKAEAAAMQTALQNADMYNRQIAWQGNTNPAQFQSYLQRLIEYKRLLNLQEQRGFYSPMQAYAFKQQEMQQMLLMNKAMQQGYQTPDQYLGYLTAKRQLEQVENTVLMQRGAAIRDLTNAELGLANAQASSHKSAQQLATSSEQAKVTLAAISGTSVTAKISVDDTDLTTDVPADISLLHTLGGIVSRPKVELNDAGFFTGVAAIEAALAKLSATRAAFAGSIPVVGDITRLVMTSGTNVGAGPPLGVGQSHLIPEVNLAPTTVQALRQAFQDAVVYTMALQGNAAKFVTSGAGTTFTSRTAAAISSQGVVGGQRGTDTLSLNAVPFHQGIASASAELLAIGAAVAEPRLELDAAPFKRAITAAVAELAWFSALASKPEQLAIEAPKQLAIEAGPQSKFTAPPDAKAWTTYTNAEDAAAAAAFKDAQAFDAAAQAARDEARADGDAAGAAGAKAKAEKDAADAAYAAAYAANSVRAADNDAGQSAHDLFLKWQEDAVAASTFTDKIHYMNAATVAYGVESSKASDAAKSMATEMLYQGDAAGNATDAIHAANAAQLVLSLSERAAAANVDNLSVSMDKATAAGHGFLGLLGAGSGMFGGWNKDLVLFGGALDDVGNVKMPHMLTRITTLTLGLHALLDFLIVLVPAIIAAGVALGSFALAAEPAFLDIQAHVTGLHTALDALGTGADQLGTDHIGPLTTKMGTLDSTTKPVATTIRSMQAAMAPTVVTIFGAAINGLGNHMQLLQSIAQKTGNWITDMIIKIEGAVNTHGSALSGFINTAMNDLRILGSIGSSMLKIFDDFVVAGERTHVSELLFEGIAYALSLVAKVLSEPWASWLATITIGFFAVVHYGGLLETMLFGLYNSFVGLLTKIPAVGAAITSFTDVTKGLAAAQATSIDTQGELIAAYERQELAVIALDAAQADATTTAEALAIAQNELAVANARVAGAEVADAAAADGLAASQDAAAVSGGKLRAALAWVTTIGAGPFLLIAAALAGIGFAIYKAGQASNQAKSQIQAFQSALASDDASQGLAQIQTNLGKINDYLVNTAKTSRNFVGNMAQGWSNLFKDAGHGIQVYKDLWEAITGTNQQVGSTQAFLKEQTTEQKEWTTTIETSAYATKQFGVTASQSFALMDLAGVKVTDSLATQKAKVDALVTGWTNMGVAGYKAANGTNALGAAINVVSLASEVQNSQITTLTGDYTAFFNLVTGGETTFESFGQAILTVGTNAKAAGASMTGTNAASLTLRQSLESAAQAAQTNYNALVLNNAAAGNTAQSYAQLTAAGKDQVAILALQGGATQENTNAMYVLAQNMGYVGANSYTAISKWAGVTKSTNITGLMADLSKQTGNLETESAGLTGDVKNLAAAINTNLNQAIANGLVGLPKITQAVSNLFDAVRANKGKGITPTELSDSQALAGALINVYGTSKSGIAQAKNEFLATLTEMGVSRSNALKLWEHELAGQKPVPAPKIDSQAWAQQSARMHDTMAHNLGQPLPPGWSAQIIGQFKSMWNAIWSGTQHDFIDKVYDFFVGQSGHDLKGMLNNLGGYFVIAWRAVWTGFQHDVADQLVRFFTTSIPSWFGQATKNAKNWAVDSWQFFDTNYVHPVQNVFTKDIPNWFRNVTTDARNWAVSAWQFFDNNYVHPIQNIFTKDIPNWFRNVTTDARNWAVNAWQFFDNNYVHPIQNIFTKDIPNWFRNVTTDASNWATNAWNAYYKYYVRPIITFFTGGSPDSIPGALRSVGNTITGTAKNWWNDIWKNTFGKIINFFTGSGPDTIQGGLAKVPGFFGGAFGKAWDAIKKSIPGGGVVHDILHFVGLATGGHVPGEGEGDSVHAMLTPGEYVIQKPAAKALKTAYGPDALETLNQAHKTLAPGTAQQAKTAAAGAMKTGTVQHFAAGGPVGGTGAQEASIQNLAALFQADLNKMGTEWNAAAIKMGTEMTKDLSDPLKTFLTQTMEAEVKGSAVGWQGLWTSVASSFVKLVNEPLKTWLTGTMPAETKAAIPSWQSLWQGAWSSFARALSTPLQAWLSGYLPGLIRNAVPAWQSLWQGAWSGFQKTVSNPLQAWLSGYLPGLIRNAAPSWQTMWGDAWSSFQKTLSNPLQAWFTGYLPGLIRNNVPSWQALWSGAWSTFQKTVSNQLQTFLTSTLPGWIRNNAPTWQQLWSQVIANFNSQVSAPLQRFFTSTLPGWLNSSGNSWRTLWTNSWTFFNSEINNNFNTFFTNKMPSWLNSVGTKWKSLWATAATDFKSAIETPLNAFFNTALPNAIKSSFTKSLNAIITGPIDHIVTWINSISGSVGIKTVAKPSTFASGGMAMAGSVAGAGASHDNVPAMLMPGEYVIRQPARMALESAYGPNFLNQMNQADTALGSGSRGTAASQGRAGGGGMAAGGAATTALAFMNSKVGQAYSEGDRWGEPPWDCSSLTYTALHAAGIPIPGGKSDNSASLANTEANWLGTYKGATKITSAKDIGTADVLFFGGATPGPSNFGPIGHVGMSENSSTYVSAYDTAAGVAKTPISADGFVVGFSLAGSGTGSGTIGFGPKTLTSFEKAFGAQGAAIGKASKIPGLKAGTASFDALWAGLITPLLGEDGLTGGKGWAPNLGLAATDKYKAVVENEFAAALAAAEAAAAAGAAGTAASGTDLQNLISIAKYFMGQGATKQAAAGMAGTISGESGGNPESQDCVPLTYKVVTTRGILTHDQVRAGDVTTVYNPATGHVEDAVILSVPYHYGARMVRIGNDHWSVKSTHDHRWITERGLVRADQLTYDDKLILGDGWLEPVDFFEDLGAQDSFCLTTTTGTWTVYRDEQVAEEEGVEPGALWTGNSNGRGLIGWTPKSTLPNSAFTGNATHDLDAQLPLILQYAEANSGEAVARGGVNWDTYKTLTDLSTALKDWSAFEGPLHPGSDIQAGVGQQVLSALGGASPSTKPVAPSPTTPNVPTGATGGLFTGTGFAAGGGASALKPGGRTALWGAQKYMGEPGASWAGVPEAERRAYRRPAAAGGPISPWVAMWPKAEFGSDGHRPKGMDRRRYASGGKIMYDSAGASGVADIPSSAALVASYVDGYGGYPQALSRFGASRAVSISTHNTNADVADVEPGAMSTSQLAGWIARQNARGIKRPVIYSDQSQWASTKAASKGHDVSFWIADPGGSQTISGADAAQYEFSNQSGGNYDKSYVLPSFPFYNGQSSTSTSPPPPTSTSPPPSNTTPGVVPSSVVNNFNAGTLAGGYSPITYAQAKILQSSKNIYNSGYGNAAQNPFTWNGTAWVPQTKPVVSGVQYYAGPLEAAEMNIRASETVAGPGLLPPEWLATLNAALLAENTEINQFQAFVAAVAHASGTKPPTTTTTTPTSPKTGTSPPPPAVKGKPPQPNFAGAQASENSANNAKIIYEYLRNTGNYSPIQAAGAVASMWGEAQWDPEVSGDGGFGIMGWTVGQAGGPPRATGNAATDLRNQSAGILEFVKYWGDQGHVNAMNSAKTVEAAANIWGPQVEKFGSNDVHPYGVTNATNYANSVEPTAHLVSGLAAGGKALKMLQFAEAQAGKPYSLRAPFGPNSWDCAGLVWGAAQNAGVSGSPKTASPWTSASYFGNLKGSSIIKAQSKMAEADIAFFGNTGAGSQNVSVPGWSGQIGHVGLANSNNRYTSAFSGVVTKDVPYNSPFAMGVQLPAADTNSTSTSPPPTSTSPPPTSTSPTPSTGLTAIDEVEYTQLLAGQKATLGLYNQMMNFAKKWSASTGTVDGGTMDQANKLFGDTGHELNWYYGALANNIGGTQPNGGKGNWRTLAGINPALYQNLIDAEKSLYPAFANVTNMWKDLSFPAAPPLGPGFGEIPQPIPDLGSFPHGPPGTYASGGLVGRLGFGGMASGGIASPDLSSLGQSSAPHAVGGSVRSAASQSSGGPGGDGGTNVTFGDINIHNPIGKPAPESITHATQKAAFLAGRALA